MTAAGNPSGRRRREARPASAAILLAAPVADVYGFVSDLGNHPQFETRHLTILESDERDSSNGGSPVGRMRLRSPWGTREARVVIERDDPPTAFVGVARITADSRARIAWETEPVPAGTRLTLTVTALDTTLVDRLILRTGGRRWLVGQLRDCLAGVRRAWEQQPR